ncbi:MAG TPA: LPXTG cell wall anchor domain-containing protein, partial [Pseudolysinimonas sp.]|nr:LPXTG cell wall anchor domain-containing protein [Pseudolysinimonas sp.]
QVLDDAAFIVGSATGGGIFTSPTLAWTGISLAAGASTSFSYQVRVNAQDTGDHLLDNVISTPPGIGANCDPASGDPDCRTNTPVRSLQVEKTVSDPVASPGDTVTYTIVVTNTGAVAYDPGTPASFTDDLSEVLDDAAYRNDASATSGAVTFGSPTLSWTGDLAVGASATITYSVTVLASSGDGTLANRVTTPPGGGGNCTTGSTDPDCVTITDVRAYTVTKSVSSPVALPGGVLNYTITVRNIGSVPYTAAAPASVTDDLSLVLDDAAYNGDATSGATVAGSVLSWSGPLGVGAVVTITYSFTVSSPLTGDGTLTNAVAPTDPSGVCLTAADCTKTTLIRALHVSKAASETSALEGDVITYTISVENIGQVDYTNATPASFIDNLAQVSDDAAYVSGSLTNGATISSGVISWSGPLAVGATEVVTYQVHVATPDLGDHLLDNTVVTPPGLGSNCEAGSGDPACSVEVPVQSFHVSKKADATRVLPGGVITYTITVTNTGEVDYPAGAPASFTDDLAAVLDDADYQSDAAATSGTVAVVAGVLSWSGPLPIGATATITYSVQVVDPDIGDKLLDNRVVTPTGSGANCEPGSTDPECHVLIGGPSVHIQKAVSATSVQGGDVLRYTVVVTNDGQVDFTLAAPATISDDLGDVLDDATYNGDADNGAAVSGTTLTWSGPLAIGDSVTLHYSVTVRTPGGDNLIDNTIGTPPDTPSNCSGGSTDPDCSTRSIVRAFTTVKTATTLGTVRPGSTITYQILVANTGQVDYSPALPASFTDDFSQVLDDATYNMDAVGTAGSISYAAPVLTWSGPLLIGATATVTYSFTINSLGGDGKLRNAVISDGSGGNCLDRVLDPECQLVTLALHDPLPNTGSDIRVMSISALLLLAVGGLLAVLGRRRRGVRGQGNGA